MAVANFEELCKGLCEIAGAPAPDLTPDSGGALAIAVELRGVQFLVSHRSRLSEGPVLVRAAFGRLPVGNEQEACRTLLEINSQVHCMGYRFGRSPASGEIVLDQKIPLDQLTPVELYQRINSMVDGIHGWREHRFLGSPAQASA